MLDQQLGLRFDALDGADLARADLSQYDVIVVPDASPRAVRGADDALKQFMQRGGRLVAVASGAEAVAGLADIKVREPAKDSAGARSRFLAGREERERQEWRQEVPGAIFSVTLDPAHPLAFGAGLDDRTSSKISMRLSGVISPENVRRLGQGGWLVSKQMGRGSIVLFADDPLFRLFWRSAQPLLLNAILLGP